MQHTQGQPRTPTTNKKEGGTTTPMAVQPPKVVQPCRAGTTATIRMQVQPT